MLERATAIDPGNSRLFLNLATVLRSLNDSEAELAALKSALTIDPYFSLARFQRASLFEKQGKSKLAASEYHAALASLQPGTQLPAVFRGVIEHAQRLVKTNNEELERVLNERVRSVREQHVGERLDRYDDCIAAFLGKKRIYVQQPLYTHFPRLPAIEFFEREQFPWLPAVEQATAAIRTELARLLSDSLQDFVPYLSHSPDAPLNQWRELNQSKRWSALFLYRDGALVSSNSDRCPETMQVLEKALNVRIKARAPTAFFSRLEPHTRIPPHTGVTNTRLTVHIPLVIPNGCGFRVGSQIREWVPGQALIFDDTIEHEAWNDSDEPRVIMIFDIWNPLLTQAERELISAATAGIAEFYADEGVDERQTS
jgi:aspartyl/asparaginyl beta-hydroxylase (cupin superfamily)